MLGLSVN